MKAPEYFIGIMSGTSLDGVDAVLVDFNRFPPRLVQGYHLPFSAELRRRLLELNEPGGGELNRAAMAGNDLAHCYAGAVRGLLAQANFKAADIAAAGCHGQTVRHRPDLGYTVQLGNPALLAELIAITVVADFRSRDIAAGGQGAPLAPAFHEAMFRDPKRHRVIVNIGGISNLTNLPPGGETTGFDCGPGNVLMDAWCARHMGKAYDEDGAWADSGKVNRQLLDALLAHPFLSRPPPKSTGREMFNLKWLDGLLPVGKAPEEVQSTLLQFTVEAIVTAIQDHCGTPQEIYLCGGGAHNQALVTRLRRALKPKTVEATDVLGVSAKRVEAMAFAWLARQAVRGEPGNIPAVTGAKDRRILGAIYRA